NAVRRRDLLRHEQMQNVKDGVRPSRNRPEDDLWVSRKPAHVRAAGMREYPHTQQQNRQDDVGGERRASGIACNSVNSSPATHPRNESLRRFLEQRNTRRSPDMTFATR